MANSHIVQVIVTDEGTGTSPEALARIFDFGVTTKRAAGNGMGLWTVRQILSRHGGDVKIDSTPNQGTRFDIPWPRTPTHSQLRACPSTTTSASMTTNRSSQTRSMSALA